jgi:phosphate:Na+ symporter
MPSLNSLKREITQMAASALKIWLLTYEAFMKHDMEIISLALQEENKLNAYERSLTASLVELARSTSLEEEKVNIPIFVDVVADLELIGDYCKDIIERIEVKIQEKLLFSEEAVKEYSRLYEKTKDVLEEITFALEKNTFCIMQDVVGKQKHIDSLVDAYRQRHNQRLLEGICSPIACNMFLNMLDFTAAIYYHAKKIAQSLLKLKHG